MNKLITALLASLLMAGIAQAAPKTIQGTLANVIVQPTQANPTLPEAYIVLKPGAADCWYTIMPIPNASAAYGRMVVASALSAQAGNRTVSVTYDPADGCKVSQFVVLTP